MEDTEKFVYFQSGREINIMNTFVSEAIEDESIIIAIAAKERTKEITLTKFEEREI